MDIEKVGYIMYVYGLLEGEGLLEDKKTEKFLSSIELISKEAEQIYNDWDKRIDIETNEEDGYVMNYARRIILAKYGL